MEFLLIINTIYIELVIESSIIVGKYDLIVKTLQHMKKKKVGPSKSTERSYKKIALETFVKTLSMVHS